MREVSLGQAEFVELSAEVLSQDGCLCFKAHGSSMYPFIRDGDILTVQPVEAGTLNVGDVAFYRAAGDRLVAHRVVGRHVQDGQVLLTMCGDAALRSDEQIQGERVLGRVVSVQRGKKVFRLDRGAHRLAAILWVRVSPLGFLLFQLARMVKRAAAWLLRRPPARRLYRRSGPVEAAHAPLPEKAEE